MTNFDDRLSARLRTLDAAIPSPAAPDLAIGQAILRERRTRRAPGLRRGLVVLAAVIALLIGTGVVAGSRIFYAETREPELEAALAQLHASQDCLSPADADDRIRVLLVSLGYQGWDVERTQGVRDDSCVSTAVASDMHAVWLLPGYSHTAAEMVETLQAELLSRCLDRDAAIELVRTGMAGVGWPDIIISADALGPEAVPADEVEAAKWRQHVADGCYVLPGITSWDEGGRRTLYLWGD
jgi:hypothetical protein